eukprot:scpid105193/ scgid9022/ Eukaryotic translation initiation factor 4E-2; Protein LOSS OF SUSCEPTIBILITY TO POTYVIRUS 1; eIF(iso)4E; eIF-(iso)4F 25 kDa subunit; eIF-(iso)4F p28 subunit; eIF4Eiso protein; mRNA cap-binding protein
MFFRKGIKPAWEDERNANGGDFTIKFTIPLEESIDAIWEEMVFALVGESFPSPDKICGIRYLIKAKNHQIKVELWISDPQPRNDASPEAKQSFEDISLCFRSLIGKHLKKDPTKIKVDFR